MPLFELILSKELTEEDIRAIENKFMEKNKISKIEKEKNMIKYIGEDSTQGNLTSLLYFHKDKKTIYVDGNNRGRIFDFIKEKIDKKVKNNGPCFVPKN